MKRLQCSKVLYSENGKYIYWFQTLLIILVKHECLSSMQIAEMKQTESKISSNFKGRKKTKGGMYRGNKKKTKQKQKAINKIY